MKDPVLSMSERHTTRHYATIRNHQGLRLGCQLEAAGGFKSLAAKKEASQSLRFVGTGGLARLPSIGGAVARAF
jgi:hypothetical protein